MLRFWLTDLSSHTPSHSLSLFLTPTTHFMRLDIQVAGLPALLVCSTLPHTWLSVRDTLSEHRQPCIFLSVLTRKRKSEKNGGSVRLSCLPKETQVAGGGDRISGSGQSCQSSLSSFSPHHHLFQSTSVGPSFPGLVCPATAES